MNIDNNDYDELKDVKKLTLEEISESENVAELLTERELQAIGSRVLEDFEIDKKSMDEWRAKAKEAMDLCLLHKESRNTPFENSANIHHPLISTAVMQFSSRSVAEMSKSGKVAKYKVQGKDENGAKSRKGARVATHLNYQIQEQMSNWFSERDKLHTQLAVCGTSFTKTYYDPIREANQSDLIPYDQIFINNGVKNLESSPRITQLIYLTYNDIIEHQRYGLFLEDYKPSEMQMDLEDAEPIYHELIEQHTWLDLDKDGLKEPYIVVYHLAHKCVLRIAPRFDYLPDVTVLYTKDRKKVKRIIADEYFTDYHFIPSPDASFFSVGFGSILLDTNHTINTLLNQLVNAGSLATMQTIFVGKDLRIDSRDMQVEPGTLIKVDSANGAAISNNLFPLTYKEPSLVLLQLVEQLIKGANNLTSTSEVLTGTTDVTNASPNSVAMLMQQGLKVYSSIQRRIFRGFRKELTKLVKLNARYLNPAEYLLLIDPSDKELQEMFNAEGKLSDYDLQSLDIVPIVDIEDSTELEAMNKAQAIMQAGLQFANVGATDPHALAIVYYKALGVENIEMLVPPPADENKPDPAVMQAQQDMQVKMKELELKEQELHIKAAEVEARIKEIEANAMKITSEIDLSKKSLQLEALKHQFNQKSSKDKAILDSMKLAMESDLEAKKLDQVSKKHQQQQDPD